MWIMRVCARDLQFNFLSSSIPDSIGSLTALITLCVRKAARLLAPVGNHVERLRLQKPLWQQHHRNHPVKHRPLKQPSINVRELLSNVYFLSDIGMRFSFLAQRLFQRLQLAWRNHECPQRHPPFKHG